jgi:hypothetical protein
MRQNFALLVNLLRFLPFSPLGATLGLASYADHAFAPDVPEVLTIEAVAAVLDLCWRHRDELMRDTNSASIRLVHDGSLLATASLSEPLTLQCAAGSIPHL